MKRVGDSGSGLWRRHVFRNELGVGTDITVLLARNDVAAMWIGGVVAYSGGFQFIQIGVIQDPSRIDGERDGPMMGLQFADGRQRTYKGMPFRPFPNNLVPEQLLWTVQGHWNPTGWFFIWSVSPLPPRGPVTIVSSFEGAAIEESIRVIDPGPILEAASRATSIWPLRPADD